MYISKLKMLFNPGLCTSGLRELEVDEAGGGRVFVQKSLSFSDKGYSAQLSAQCITSSPHG